MPHCIHAWLKQLFSLCVLAVLVTGNGTPDTSDGESDAATDPSLFCTCRCNGCMWRMRCYDKNSSRLVLSEDACSAKGGTWCSCSQQAAAFSLAEKTGFAPFLASVGASVKDSCDERVPHDHKSEKRRPPHIVFALADDIGFHDVSWRNPIAVTPTLHALREAGVELTNFYTQSMCSPSRAALATGRYPMRYGMQSYVLIDHQPWGLPLSEVTLAQELKSVFGYETQYIGKWHIGAHTRQHTPLERGFDGFFGSYGGMQTYRSHVTQGGFDFRNGSEPYTAAKGVHTHDLVLERLDWILNDRKRRRHRTAPQSDAAEDVEEDIPPLFLMLGLQAPHCPLDEVPERFLVLYKQWLSELRASPSAAAAARMQATARVAHLALVTYMDEVIGRIITKLQMSGMWEDTLFIFSSDNGGCATGFCAGCAGGSSNFPLRGGKGTLYEGGVRGTAVLYAASPIVLPTTRRGSVIDSLAHIVDFFPTILQLVARRAQVDYVRNITHPHLDGRDLSAEIRGLNTANDEVFRDNECGFVPSVSPAATGDGDGDGYSDGQIASSIGFRSRSASTVLLGIDPFMEGAALRNGRWKIIARPAKVPNSGWSHNVTGGMNTSTPAAPAPQPRHPSSADSNSRAGGDVGGGGRDHESVPAALWVPPTNGQPVWELYNVLRDPRETRDLSLECPHVLARMRMLLKSYEASAHILSPFSIRPSKAAREVVAATGSWGPFADVTPRDYYFYPHLVSDDDRLLAEPPAAETQPPSVAGPPFWKAAAQWLFGAKAAATSPVLIHDERTGHQLRVTMPPEDSPHFFRPPAASPSLRSGAMEF